jgi:hypothetical protein
MVESGSDDLKEIEDGDGEGAVLPLSLPFILCFFKKFKSDTWHVLKRTINPMDINGPKAGCLSRAKVTQAFSLYLQWKPRVARASDE